jgi:hypothetical protein
MGFIWSLFERLVRSVADPVIDRMLRLSWWWRLTVLLAAMALALLVINAAAVSRWIKILEYNYALRNADSFDAVLSTRDNERIKKTIDSFGIELTNKLAEKGPLDPVSPWVAADIVVSLPKDMPVDAADFNQYLVKFRAPGCFCWSEYSNTPFHLGMTSWVLMTLTKLRLPDADKVADFLLTNQKPDGWWPIYPAQNSDRNASTYATAIVALALANYKEETQLTANDQVRIQNAIAGGVGWLRRQQVDGVWKDYPKAPDGIPSLSLSALALHAIHRLDPSNYDAQLSTKWLDRLPTELPPSALEYDSSAHPVFLLNGELAKDSVRYLLVPWEIVATVDAFPDGTVMQKVKALDWFTRALEKVRGLESTLDEQTWQVAEGLIALRSARGDPPL